jgi:hypothetical protein
MNRRFRPLTCFRALAVLVALSSDATALARYKQTPDSNKAHEATGARHLRNDGLKKRGHMVDVAAPPRKSALAVDAAAESPLSSIWRERPRLVKRPLSKRQSAIRLLRSLLNGTFCGTRTPMRSSADLRRL